MDTRLIKYKTLAHWSKETLPEFFQKKHNTKAGTWAKLTILGGELKFFGLDEDGNEQAEHVFSAENPAPFIEPQAWHRVQPLSDDLECFLEFYCLPENYYQKKYRLSAPHSEARGILDYLQQGKVMDLGSGS